MSKAAAQVTGLPLFGGPDPAPKPPTGPAATIPAAKSNTLQAYREWRLTVDGALVWNHVEALALYYWHEGETRISVNSLVEEVRRNTKRQVNNTYRAWIADDLVAAYPKELSGVVERRRRRKHG